MGSSFIKCGSGCPSLVVQTCRKKMMLQGSFLCWVMLCCAQSPSPTPSLSSLCPCMQQPHVAIVWDCGQHREHEEQYNLCWGAHKATSKPNPSQYGKLGKECTRCAQGLGLELKFYFNSPLPQCLWGLVGWCLRVGLGILDYSLIQSRRLVACSVAIEKQGGNETSSFDFASLHSLKLSPRLNSWSASPYSLSPLSVSNQQSNFKAKSLSIWWIRRRVHKMCTGARFGIEILF
jgi:hypothetical protein